MNLWKPVALLSIAGLVSSVGLQLAAAAPADARTEVGAGVCHDQPHMAAAVASLKEARAQLEKAEHNKGGWRVKAIEATNAAIVEADKGCAFADK